MADIWDPAEDLLCGRLDPWPFAEDICFPGGFCISAMVPPDEYPRASDLVNNLLNQVGPAMAPLSPFFNVLDTVLALFRCVEAIPDAITSLNPSGIINCIPDLAEKINALLSMIPQLSIPRLIKSLIRNLATFIRGFASDLQAVQRRLEEIAEAINEAADLDDVTWSGFLQCSEQTVEDEVFGLSEALKGIGRIILLANILLSLLSGAPEIPCFGTIMEDLDVLDPIIETMLGLADLLDELANAIPDPQLAITLALQGETC